MRASKNKTTHHFESLDAFRGLAAVMIVLYHSQFFVSHIPNDLVKNSYIFVDFFFILSGFVMAYAYMERILKGVGLKSFFILRFARLYPLHLFTLLVWIPYISIKIYLYQHGVGETDPTGENNLVTFIQNLFLLQGFSLSTSWNYPSWSIGVEFYTYLIFYFVVILLGKVSLLWRYAGVVIVSLFSFYLLFSEDFSIWHNLYRCISEFFLGALLFELYRNTSFQIKSSFLSSLIEMILMGTMLYTVIYIETEHGYKYLTLLLFSLIVYFFAIQKKGVISQLLLQKSLQHLGKISYSVYMTHAIVVTGVYNVLVYTLHLETGSVDGVPTGVIVPYALFLNIVFLVVVVGISTWTYRHIELYGQSYIKRKFLK